MAAVVIALETFGLRSYSPAVWHNSFLGSVGGHHCSAVLFPGRREGRPLRSGNVGADHLVIVCPDTLPDFSKTARGALNTRAFRRIPCEFNSAAALAVTDRATIANMAPNMEKKRRGDIEKRVA
jgi:hypothetical protein